MAVQVPGLLEIRSFKYRIRNFKITQIQLLNATLNFFLTDVWVILSEPSPKYKKNINYWENEYSKWLQF